MRPTCNDTISLTDVTRAQRQPFRYETSFFERLPFIPPGLGERPGLRSEQLTGIRPFCSLSAAEAE
jgi:hypothetical protein